MNRTRGLGFASAALVTLLAAACGGSEPDTKPGPTAKLAATADPCPVLQLPAGAVAPVSDTGAYLCAASFGASDLDSAVKFYSALGMNEKSRMTREGRTEVLMVAADARGSQLVLFHHTDSSAVNYQRNPGKIVFNVKDATGFADALTRAGGQLLSPPRAYMGGMVGFGRDLDNNLVEFTSDASAKHSYISAFGVGVSDLERAKSFYVDGLDMKVLTKLQIEKAPGVAWYDEYILTSSSGKGSAVVLMTYTDGVLRNYKDNPVKLMLRADDPIKHSARITAAGQTILKAFAPSTEPPLGGASHSLAKDADGTLIEVFRQPSVDPCPPLSSSATATVAGSTGAYLCAAGFAVADLSKSVAYYQQAFGFTEVARYERADRHEVVLDSPERRGSKLALFQFKDGRGVNTRQNPGKVVFYVKDTAATVAAIAAGGGGATPPSTFLGRSVSFSRDPDNNLVEITSDPSTATSYLSAFGIGTADLESAKDFYVNALDMKVLTKLNVDKAAGVPWYEEYILTSNSGRGSAVVLMRYVDGSKPNYQGNPVRLTLRSDRPGQFAQRIQDAGQRVLQAPVASREAALGDALIGQALDADGTALELLSSPN